MVTSGVRRVVFDDDYPDDLACKLAEEAGVELVRFDTLISKEEEGVLLKNLREEVQS